MTEKQLSDDHQEAGGTCGQDDVNGVTVKRVWRGWDEWKVRCKAQGWGGVCGCL